MQPLISIIIPATRDDEYLRLAIESALSDGYKNLEVIVVWDGPLQASLRELPGVNYISTGGLKGASAANNLGLDVARGDYIARLDADDISLPGRFAAQLAALEADPGAILCVTNAAVIDSAGEYVRDFPALRSGALPEVLLKSNRIVHSSFMFRRNAARYNPACVRMQDYELCLRLALTSRIALVESQGVNYRVHDGQSGRNTSSFWRYIPVLLHGRCTLARSLGRSRVPQIASNLAWFSIQLLNHLGLRDRYASLLKR